MARTALQRLAVLHHGLDGVGVEGTGKTLGLTLHTLDHRNGCPVLCEIGIYVEHALCLGFSLLTGGMCCVALLPEEL